MTICCGRFDSEISDLKKPILMITTSLYYLIFGYRRYVESKVIIMFNIVMALIDTSFLAMFEDIRKNYIYAKKYVQKI